MTNESAIVSQAVAQAAQAEDDALMSFKQKHGRWPLYTWHTIEPRTDGDEVRLDVSADAGDEVPADVRSARCTGVLNEREVNE